MNWHHHNARRSSEIFINQFFANIGRSKPSVEAVLKRKDQTIADILRIMEFWLRHGNLYLVSATEPTVADLSCYNEVVQLEVMGLLEDVESKFPRVAAWLKRMKVRFTMIQSDSLQVGACELTAFIVCLVESSVPRRDARADGQVLPKVQAREALSASRRAQWSALLLLVRMESTVRLLTQATRVLEVVSAWMC